MTVVESFDIALLTDDILFFFKVQDGDLDDQNLNFIPQANKFLQQSLAWDLIMIRLLKPVINLRTFQGLGGPADRILEPSWGPPIL